MPRYERPVAPLPAQWPATANSTTAIGAANLDWQTYLTDPTLRQLVDTALTNNRDMRVAILAIEQASAQ